MNALALTASRRLVAPVEHYNDSADAKYTRSLDQRCPFVRSSSAQIVVLDEPAKRLAPHQLALYGAYLIAVVALALYA